MKFEDMINNVILGDCYEVIKSIPDKSIDFICIDPPYKIETQGGGHSILAKSIQKQHKELEDNNIVNGINNDILDLLCNKMKNINIAIFCNKNQLLQYMNYFNQKGALFDIITWHKNNAIPNFSFKYMSDTEYCLIFRKGSSMNKKTENYEDRKTWFVSNINVSDKNKFAHPTIKPLALVDKIIRNHTQENDIVLDCFCGSGTTCVACKNTNRRYIGIELNPKWHKVAVDRLNNVQADGQQTLFTI